MTCDNDSADSVTDILGLGFCNITVGPVTLGTSMEGVWVVLVGSTSSVAFAVKLRNQNSFYSN